jgi:hypothetical protein
MDSRAEIRDFDVVSCEKQEIKEEFIQRRMKLIGVIQGAELMKDPVDYDFPFVSSLADSALDLVVEFCKKFLSREAGDL